MPCGTAVSRLYLSQPWRALASFLFLSGVYRRPCGSPAALPPGQAAASWQPADDVAARDTAGETIAAERLRWLRELRARVRVYTSARGIRGECVQVSWRPAWPALRGHEPGNRPRVTAQHLHYSRFPFKLSFQIKLALPAFGLFFLPSPDEAGGVDATAALALLRALRRTAHCRASIRIPRGNGERVVIAVVFSCG